MKKKLKILSYFIRIPIAIIISPILYLFFKISPNKLFFYTFSALWPHLTILDENGKLYLRRWFLTPKCKWYRPWFLHFIGQSDKGRFPHCHPSRFKTKILSGGYVESIFYPFDVEMRKAKWCDVRTALPGMILDNPDNHVHMVNLIAPTFSLVKGWVKGKPWYFYKLDPLDAAKDTAIESNVYTSKGQEIKSWE